MASLKETGIVTRALLRALGRLPAGFRQGQLGRLTVIFRHDFGRELGDPLTQLATLANEQKRASGRGRGRGGEGSVTEARLAGRNTILRRYLHGGLTRGCVPQAFPSPRRLLAEIHVAEAARQAGVPVAAVLGGVIERVGWHVYRLWLLTEKVDNAEDGVALWLRLLNGESAQVKDAALRALGKAVRTMHDAGVVHGDLHLKNILFRRGDGAMNCVILDLDQARLLPHVSRADRVANLRRLVRSVNRRDPRQEILTPADRLRLLKEYLGSGDESELRPWAAAIAKPHRWHELWWKLTGKQTW